VNEHGVACELFGVLRLIRVDDSRGEFALFVRSDIQKQGLGYRLMQEMFTWAWQHGVERVDGELLRENAKMLRLVKSLGGATVPKDNDFSTVRVAFGLSTASLSRLLSLPTTRSGTDSPARGQRKPGLSVRRGRCVPFSASDHIAHIRSPSALRSTSARPSASIKGGAYMPKRPCKPF